VWWTGSERSRFGINLKIRVQSANPCLTNLCFRNPCFTICPQSLCHKVFFGLLVSWLCDHMSQLSLESHRKTSQKLLISVQTIFLHLWELKFIFLIVFVGANVTTGESQRALRFVDRVCLTFDKTYKKNWRRSVATNLLNCALGISIPKIQIWLQICRGFDFIMR